MSKSKIIFFLSFIIILPLVIYTIYEFVSLNDNEEIIEEVYNQQMLMISKSVNRNILEATYDLSDKAKRVIASEDADKIDSFFNEYNFISGITILDIDLKNPQVFSIDPSKISTDETLTFLSTKLRLIEKLVSRNNLGFNKFEAFTNEYDTELTLLNILSINGENKLAVFKIDFTKFFDAIIEPNALEFDNADFKVLVYNNKHNDIPLGFESDGKVISSNINRKLWLIPDYSIHIYLRDNLLEELSTNRIQKSLIVGIILLLVLTISGFYLFRNFSKEIELAKLKTDFVSNVSHELRTPLSLIKMFAETLELGRADDQKEVKEFAKIIHNESERLTLLINRILDFSKIDAGEKNFKLTRIDLNRTSQDVFELYRSVIGENGFKLKENYSMDELCINGDKETISEVIVNLIDNAMKYSEKEKYIEINTGQENGEVYFEIIDKGIGISKKHQEKVFEKFFRVENALTTDKKGSGLGLSLTKQIIDAHNGKIEIDSKLEKGTKFRLVFNKV